MVTSPMSSTGFHLPPSSGNTSGTMTEVVSGARVAVKDVKKFLSVKSTDSKPEGRLPPLETSRARKAVVDRNGVLPPIKGLSSGSSTQPSTELTEKSSASPSTPPSTPPFTSKSAPPSTPPFTSPSAPPSTPPSTPPFTVPSAPPASDTPPSYNNFYTESRLTPHNADFTRQNGATISRDNPFITSQLRGEPAVLRQSARDPTNDANQPESMATRIKDNGIRTYPALAVISVFICCPIFGMFAAMLSLKAENSFYQKQYIQAHKEGFVARICLLLAIVFGIITIVSVIAYLFSAQQISM